MRPYIENIIGKQICGVVTSAKTVGGPRERVYLVFTDGTYFELFGDDISCASHVEIGNLASIVEYLEGNRCDNIKVYFENES